MKKYLSSLIVGISLLLGVATVALPASAGAISVWGGCGSGGGTGSGSTSGTGGTGSTGGVSTNLNDGSSASGSTICSGSNDDLNKMMKTIINVILTILGTIAVIMIIIGGIRYTTSNGDASQIKSAKDTIMYAVVGLVVAILAFAIVNFVIGAFK